MAPRATTTSFLTYVHYTLALKPQQETPSRLDKSQFVLGSRDRNAEATDLQGVMSASKDDPGTQSKAIVR